MSAASDIQRNYDCFHQEQYYPTRVVVLLAMSLWMSFLLENRGMPLCMVLFPLFPIFCLQVDPKQREAFFVYYMIGAIIEGVYLLSWTIVGAIVDGKPFYTIVPPYGLFLVFVGAILWACEVNAFEEMRDIVAKATDQRINASESQSEKHVHNFKVPDVSSNKMVPSGSDSTESETKQEQFSDVHNTPDDDDYEGVGEDSSTCTTSSKLSFEHMENHFRDIKT